LVGAGVERQELENSIYSTIFLLLGLGLISFKYCVLKLQNEAKRANAMRKMKLGIRKN